MYAGSLDARGNFCSSADRSCHATSSIKSSCEGHSEPASCSVLVLAEIAVAQLPPPQARPSFDIIAALLWWWMIQIDGLSSQISCATLWAHTAPWLGRQGAASSTDPSPPSGGRDGLNKGLRRRAVAQTPRVSFASTGTSENRVNWRFAATCGQNWREPYICSQIQLLSLRSLHKPVHRNL
jgi:hypothetical protein